MLLIYMVQSLHKAILDTWDTTMRATIMTMMTTLTMTMMMMMMMMMTMVKIVDISFATAKAEKAPDICILIDSKLTSGCLSCTAEAAASIE